MRGFGRLGVAPGSDDEPKGVQQMKEIDVVCLCRLYDLKAFLSDHMARDNPWLRLVTSDEVTDPAAIRHAIAFSPSAQDFDRYPNLKLVSCAGAGVDGLLQNRALRNDIAISRVIVPEQAQAIAAFAIWHIVNWQRRLSDYAQQQQEGIWHPINRSPPTEFPVGILGYGAIGKTLADALVVLGYPVMAYASRSRQDGAVNVVSGSDGLAAIARDNLAVVNLLPLTTATRGILSASVFTQMRTGSILIHLGRGDHLVEEDLTQALKRGRPERAALDVFSTEPLPKAHPFWRNNKVLITPHVAGDADYRDVATFIAKGITEFERGEDPEGLVNRTRGY